MQVEMRNYSRESLLIVNLLDMSYQTKDLAGNPIDPAIPPFKVFEDGGLKSVYIEDLWRNGENRSYDDIIIKLLEFKDRSEVFVKMKGWDHTELKVVDYIIDKPSRASKRGYLIFSRGFEVLPMFVENISLAPSETYNLNFTTGNGFTTTFHLKMEGLSEPLFKIEIGYNNTKLVEYLGNMLSPTMFDLTGKRYWYTFSSALPPNANCYIKITNQEPSATITIGSLYVIPQNMIYRLIKAYIW